MEGIYAYADLIKVYKAILDSAQEIANYLRYDSTNKISTQNVFGDLQNEMDIKADNVIFSHLKKSGVVYAAMSEEKPFLNELNSEGDYVVTFDPIDGGSIIDANFAVASIFAIWNKKDINGSTGRDVVGAALAIYGSRTTMLLYNTHNQHVEELTLIKMGLKERWIVTNPDLKIANKAKIFSPEGVRACYDNPAYLRIFEHYCKAGYSIRYSGGMACDCYQMFIKGQGIYCSIDSVAHPAKLRLLYECIPIAFLVEAAGGKTTNGDKSILDIVIDGYQQKSAIICGSSEEVGFVNQNLKGEGELTQ